MWVWDFAGVEGSPRQLVLAPSTVTLVHESPLFMSHHQQRSLEDHVRMTAGHDSWIDHKRAVYWQSGLNAAEQHNITYNSK